jgi:hypothetical protein
MTDVYADFSEVDELAVDLAAAGAEMLVASKVIVGTEADNIRDDASARSPVLTGALAAGWYVADGGDGSKIITTDVPYAFYQEFGTTRHGPQPSLFPAADRGEDRLALALTEAVVVL